MKQYLLGAVLALTALLISGCGAPPAAEGTPSAPSAQPSRAVPAVSAPVSQQPQPLLLTAQDHPELDFSTAEDGLPMIRDFCFTPEGTVLILQLSGSLFEYDFSGTLLGTYDFRLLEQGLSAYRVISGGGDTLYLLDGHNNAVLTATRAGVIASAPLSQVSMDTGLLSRIDCIGAGELAISYFDVDAGHSWTYPMTVDGGALTLGDPWPGQVLTGSLTFQPWLSDPTAGSSETVTLAVYRAGETVGEYTVASRTEGAVFFGMTLYGMADGAYFGKFFEFLPDPARPDGMGTAETFFLLDPDTGAVQTGDSALSGGETIRFYQDAGWYLSLREDGLSIDRLSSACSGWTASEAYQVSLP